MSDLFVQKSDYFLGLSNQKIIIKNSQREIEREVSIYLVDNLLIFGQAQISTQLLRALARENINVYYFSSEGKFLACLDSYRQEDFDKQEKQVRACLGQDFCLVLSKEIVSAKVKHQLSLLKSYNQDGILSVDEFGRFHLTLQKIKEAESISQIMGYEGRIAKSYFYYLSLLVPDSFRFHGRRTRPAEDCFNCLLNFGYTILYSCFLGLIRKNGLSYGFGILHQSHGHHACLASDLMEEWRPVIVDNTIMQLILEESLKDEHFETKADGTFILKDEGRKTFLLAMRERMLEIHQYIELDKKRYSFFYTTDQQIKRLIRAFEQQDSHLYVTAYTGEE